MNHMVDINEGSYKLKKHWIDKEEIRFSNSPKSKNEMKTKSFIVMKHKIQNTTSFENWTSLCHYVEIYSKLTATESAIDIAIIKKMLADKQTELTNA